MLLHCHFELIMQVVFVIALLQIVYCYYSSVFGNLLLTLWLYSIHQIPSVPIVDCYQKIRQQVKCYLQMAGVMGKNELQEVS